MLSFRSSLAAKIRILILLVLCFNLGAALIDISLDLPNIWRFAILFVTFIASFLAVQRFIKTRIVKPLSSFDNAFSKMLDGELKHKIEIESHDEFLLLANRFNELNMKLLSTMKTLSDSEERYRAISESAGEGIILYNSDNIIMYVNKAASEILNYDKDHILGQQISMFFPRAGFLSKENSREEVNHISEIINIFSKERKEIPIEISVTRIKIADNPAYIAILHVLPPSLSDLHKALRDEEEFLHNFIEEIQTGILILNPQGRILMHNTAIEEIIGYKVEDFYSKDFFEKIFPDAHYREQNAVYISRVASGLVINKKEFHARDSHNNKKVLLITAKMVPPQNNFILIVRDITERKNLEQNLMQVQKMEGVGTLAAGLAHDFNNLLTGILGYSNMLRIAVSGKLPGYNIDSNPFPRKKLLQYLERIENASQRASHITGQMLAISRKHIYQPQPLNLNQIIEEVLSLLKRVLNKNIVIQIKRSMNAAIIEADPSQIIQIIMNLCINAQDSMPSGGVLIIETDIISFPDVSPGRNLKTGPYVVLIVTDSGKGIEKEILTNIWEPFFTTKEPGKGTGLGLSMVKSIVIEYEGFVDVKSEEGKGSSFYIYFPESKAFLFEEKKSEEDMPSGHESVLIIDDDEIALTFTQNVLEDMGYKTHTASTGEEGIEKYKQYYELIDLVILDIVLPNMDGQTVFQELKKINPNVRVLLFSGYSQYSQSVEIINIGARGFLQKPFRIVDFTHKVREALRKN
ncbi:MAG: PAS domain S-box protein [Candidatus Coatesbacteria bacterium]|nr:PAS domain S-box protein [Candidatus Coatesbacteria bacterium]